MKGKIRITSRGSPKKQAQLILEQRDTINWVWIGKSLVFSI